MLDVFDAWLSELRRVPVTGLDRAALCDAAAASGRLRAALDAFDARLGAATAALDDAGPGPSVVFRSAAKCSQREADRRARRAEALAEMPSTSDALATGSISAEHVDVLARAAAVTSAGAVEQSGLIETAAQRPADLLARDVRAWTRRQQSAASLEEQQRVRHQARRCVIFDNDEGMTVLHAEFDPIAGAAVRAAIDGETNRLFHADGGRTDAAAQRSGDQRRADALAGLLTSGAPGGNRPVRHQMLVIAHADGSAEIPGTGPIPPAELERLACTSDLFGLVFSTDGEPLWHGNAVRLADDNQWRALIARDGGCVICGAHPGRCEAHHVKFAAPPTRGPTDIDNLALLCRHDHHLVHDQGHRLGQRPDGSWALRSPSRQRPSRRPSQRQPGPTDARAGP